MRNILEKDIRFRDISWVKKAAPSSLTITVERAISTPQGQPPAWQQSRTGKVCPVLMNIMCIQTGLCS